MTLVSKTAAPPKDVKELLDWIRAEKDKIIYGHAGVGSASHLCALIFMKELGVQMQGVAYRGTGPAMNDLISGQFDFMCDQTTNTTNQIKVGKIKGYAVTTKFKVSSVSDLPTLDSTCDAWLRGVRVARHVGSQRACPNRFPTNSCSALQAALKDEKVIERFASVVIEPVAWRWQLPMP